MTRRQAPSHFRGFTLLETVIVLMLITLVLAMAAPSLRGWRRGAMLRDAADSLLATAAWCRSQAIADATVYQLQIDPAGRGWGVATIAGHVIAPAKGEFGHGLQLPPALRVEVTSGPGTIAFHANGRTTPATMRVGTLDGGDWVELRCEAPAEPFRLVQEGAR